MLVLSVGFLQQQGHCTQRQTSAERFIEICQSSGDQSLAKESWSCAAFCMQADSRCSQEYIKQFLRDGGCLEQHRSDSVLTAERDYLQLWLLLS